MLSYNFSSCARKSSNNFLFAAIAAPVSDMPEVRSAPVFARDMRDVCATASFDDD